MALNVDAGVPRPGGVIADGVGAAAKVSAVQHECEDARQHDKERKLKRQRSPDVALTEPGKAFGIVVQCLIAEQNVSNAAIEAHSADGDDDGGEVKPRHQQAVEQPAQQAHA